MTALIIFDKEAIDNLLRRRFTTAERYLSVLYNFKPKDLELLKKLINSQNKSGKPLMPSQKVECINLLWAYKINNINCSLIEKEIVNGKVIIRPNGIHRDKGRKVKRK